jgi:hypothetical protein
MPMLIIPTKQLEALAMSSDLYSQAKSNWERRKEANANDRTTAEFNAAVMELMRAKVDVADSALQEWNRKQYIAGPPAAGGTPLDVMRRHNITCPVCGTNGAK